MSTPYQAVSDTESLLIPSATEAEVSPEEVTFYSRKNISRVATAILVAFMVSAFALRVQVLPSTSADETNSPADILRKAPMQSASPMAASGASSSSSAATVVLDDPDHPAAVVAGTKPATALTDIRSDTRLSPLFMSRYTDTNGMLQTFFSKYGLVGNRLTDKEKYQVPKAVLTTEVKGDAASWAYATMYSGSSCQGGTVSMAGLASGECIPVAGFGGDDSQAFMVDCSSSQVILNGYTTQDCSSAVSSSAVLAAAGTCYQYSSTMYENPTDSPLTDSSTSTSVVSSCGTPSLSGYDVEKMFITADTSASDVCEASSASAYDGQMFEAIPTETCIAQSLGDDNEFSVKFSKDETNSPFLTYYFNRCVMARHIICLSRTSRPRSPTCCDVLPCHSPCVSLTCDSDKTAASDLSTTCASQGLTGASAYAKWSYHP